MMAKKNIIGSAVKAAVFFVFVLWSQAVLAQRPGQRISRTNYAAYLFVYFTGNDKEQEQIRFALSEDGFHYRALNGDRPVIASADISETGGVRDPHILRAEDGHTFYMVATDMVSAKGWNSNRGIVLLKSTDLIHWTSSRVNIQRKYAGQDSLLRVWAPQTIYDKAAGRYMIYFSMKHGRDPDKIYYVYANDNFTDVTGEPKQLFYSEDNAACIDGDIIGKDNRFYLFFKTEDSKPGIKIAVSDHLTYGYKLEKKDYVQQTTSPVEGAGTFKLNDGSGYVLMYDMYTSGKYQFTRTTDLMTFRVADDDVSMNFHPRHGTVISLTREEAKRLTDQWLSPGDVIQFPVNRQIRIDKTVLDTAGHAVYFLSKPGAGLSASDLRFPAYCEEGIKLSPGKTRDKGEAIFTVKRAGGVEQFHVSVTETHNPVLPGYFADPDILYSRKMRKFYMYPTSDGFTGWSGDYFKAFSSVDLVNWKDEGKILQLGKDVGWANRNAWAPCIIEKQKGSAFKYYFYYTAAQKIGVAVSSSPTGPFVDSGHPLINGKPEGVTGGQEIDPAVFKDPATGKCYLYWGNGYMCGAELGDDMISLKQHTITVLHPGSGFREGTNVFYRQGKYYFLWSEDDTRSPDYHVAYGISDSPLGVISREKDNIILSKATTSGIYGTGHNAVLKIPGRDEWYIAYHRFSYPNGITMGEAAGYNREVCIDRLEFREDGSIKPVTPTHAGIAPVKL